MISHEHMYEKINKLTPREKEVLQLVMDGRTNKSIGNTLGISDRTAELHRSHVMNKIGAENVVDLVKQMIFSGHYTQTQ
jgi:FixJ family two-component response regulator